MRLIHRPKTRPERRHRRHLRVRNKVQGTKERPRLVVYRSLRYMYAQLVDDSSGTTIVAYSDRVQGFAGDKGKGGKIGVAFAVGKGLAERARKHGVSRVVFDRGGYLYHGRVRAVADGAREGGLEF